MSDANIGAVAAWRRRLGYSIKVRRGGRLRWRGGDLYVDGRRARRGDRLSIGDYHHVALVSRRARRTAELSAVRLNRDVSVTLIRHSPWRGWVSRLTSRVRNRLLDW